MGGNVLMVSIPKISKGTWIRTIILFISLINGAMAMYGKHPLPISDGDVNNFVSAAALIVSAVVSWWHNNNFTKKARINEKINNG